MAIDRENRS